MHPRLELDKVAPEALKAVLQVSAYSTIIPAWNPLC